MGLNIININASNLSQDCDLRMDTKFFSFWKKSKWNAFDLSLGLNDSTPLSKILFREYLSKELENNIEYKGIPTGKKYLDEDGYIISYLPITKDNKPDRLKHFCDNDHILISSLRGARSPALNFDYDISEYVFSNGFYFFKLNDGWNKKFILYFLRTNWINTVIDNSIYRGIGISSYKERDLLKIRLPKISIETQKECVDRILPLEIKIKTLKNHIKPESQIINTTFYDHFTWDIETFSKLKDIWLMSRSFSLFSDNIDNRFSFKFHNKAGEYVSQILKSQTSKRIKDYVATEITLGKSISPSDYDENGGQYYLSMAAIKNWQFENEEAKTVSHTYFNSNPNKRVALNDIIMARSGEGTIGKVAIIDNQDIEAVYSDFTMRIRLKDYNHLFAYYYFRTEFFQHLIYTHKKGLGNNTNIFPSQIKEFPIPDISLEDQEKIVAQIKTELDGQKEIKRQIEDKRIEIRQIIEKAIKK